MIFCKLSFTIHNFYQITTYFNLHDLHLIYDIHRVLVPVLGDVFAVIGHDVNLFFLVPAPGHFLAEKEWRDRGHRLSGGWLGYLAAWPISCCTPLVTTAGSWTCECFPLHFCRRQQLVLRHPLSGCCAECTDHSTGQFTSTLVCAVFWLCVG